MGLPIFTEIEKLITEHGSAQILKERLELAKDQTAALEKKLADSEDRAKKFENEGQVFELDNLKLKERIRTLEAQLAKPRIERLEEIQENILGLLAQQELSTDEITQRISVSLALAEYHVGELISLSFLERSFEILHTCVWKPTQDGRRYLAKHGLLS